MNVSDGKPITNVSYVKGREIKNGKTQEYKFHKKLNVNQPKKKKRNRL